MKTNSKSKLETKKSKDVNLKEAKEKDLKKDDSFKNAKIVIKDDKLNNSNISKTQTKNLTTTTIKLEKLDESKKGESSNRNKNTNSISEKLDIKIEKSSSNLDIKTKESQKEEVHKEEELIEGEYKPLKLEERDPSLNVEANKVEQRDSNNIKVVARFRPLNEFEKELMSNGTGKVCCEFFDSDSCAVKIISDMSTTSPPFVLDHIFRLDTTQKQFYDHVAKPSLLDVVNGYNSTIFTYGQSGSGKTHTMYGSIYDDEYKGVIPRIIDNLFQIIDTSPETINYQIKFSIIQIYKEVVYDLLSGEKDLKVKESPSRGIYVEGLSEFHIDSIEKFLELLELSQSQRIVSGTNLNAQSSRSHTIFMLELTSNNSVQNVTKKGCMNLVDLAGTEKVSKSGAVGKTFEEGVKINMSLSALGNVIHALTSGESFIPYRDSKLTRILQESLGGNFKTTLVVACSPHSYHIEETTSTLKFAQRAKTIKNKVKMNIKLSYDQLLKIIKNYKEDIEKLNKNNEKLKNRIRSLIASGQLVNSNADDIFNMNDDNKAFEEIDAKFDYVPQPKENDKNDIENVANTFSIPNSNIRTEGVAILENQIVELKNEIKDLKKALAEKEELVNINSSDLLIKVNELYKKISKVKSNEILETDNRSFRSDKSDNLLKTDANDNIFKKNTLNQNKSFLLQVSNLLKVLEKNGLQTLSKENLSLIKELSSSFAKCLITEESEEESTDNNIISNKKSNANKDLNFMKVNFISTHEIHDFIIEGQNCLVNIPNNSELDITNDKVKDDKSEKSKKTKKKKKTTAKAEIEDKEKKIENPEKNNNRNIDVFMDKTVKCKIALDITSVLSSCLYNQNKLLCEENIKFVDIIEELTELNNILINKHHDEAVKENMYGNLFDNNQFKRSFRNILSRSIIKKEETLSANKVEKFIDKKTLMVSNIAKNTNEEKLLNEILEESDQNNYKKSIICNNDETKNAKNEEVSPERNRNIFKFSRKNFDIVKENNSDEEDDDNDNNNNDKNKDNDNISPEKKEIFNLQGLKSIMKKKDNAFDQITPKNKNNELTLFKLSNDERRNSEDENSPNIVRKSTRSLHKTLSAKPQNFFRSLLRRTSTLNLVDMVNLEGNNQIDPELEEKMLKDEKQKYIIKIIKDHRISFSNLKEYIMKSFNESVRIKAIYDELRNKIFSEKIDINSLNKINNLNNEINNMSFGVGSSNISNFTNNGINNGNIKSHQPKQNNQSNHILQNKSNIVLNQLDKIDENNDSINSSMYDDKKIKKTFQTFTDNSSKESPNKKYKTLNNNNNLIHKE